MAEFPKFSEKPRAWVTAMLDLLMRPENRLAPKDAEYVRRQREIWANDEARTPGEGTREAISRVARRYRLIETRRHAGALRRARQAEVQQQRAIAVPPAFAVGAPMPKPPPLRRPVIALGGGPTETWDPSVGGL